MLMTASPTAPARPSSCRCRVRFSLGVARVAPEKSGAPVPDPPRRPSGTGQCIYGGAMDNDLLRNPWWQMQQKQACIAAEFDRLRQLAMPGSEFERLRSMFGGGQPLRENPRPRPP